MRRILLLLLVLVPALAVACSRGEPTIAVEAVQLDLGDVPNGEIATRNVAVHNAGNAVLVIEQLTTSCGCTTATLEPMALQAGKSGILHIEYDAGAHGPELTGPLMRQVFITSNDPAQPEVIVELAVNVTPPLAPESN